MPTLHAHRCEKCENEWQEFEEEFKCPFCGEEDKIEHTSFDV